MTGPALALWLVTAVLSGYSVQGVTHLLLGRSATNKLPGGPIGCIYCLGAIDAHWPWYTSLAIGVVLGSFCHCLYLLSFWFKSERGLLNPDPWDT